MIALLFDLPLVQSTCPTSQPKQPKSVVWGLLRPCTNPIAEHLTIKDTISPRSLNKPSIEDVDGRYLRHPAEARKKHAPSSSNSPDHPFHSPNTFPDDRLCLVCDAHYSASCVVCDQDFCNTHLYACVECGDQYCSRCLDDHRADGHWTDSDTAAERNHGWRCTSSSGGSTVGSMHVSPPSGLDASPVTDPRLSFTTASSQVAGHTQRSATSPRAAQNALTSPVTFLRAIRQGLSLAANCTVVKLLSQSEIAPEVSL